MKLREFIENLNNFVKENPETLDLDVITSKDAEGNGFNHVYYEPTKGFFEDGDYVTFERFGEELSLEPDVNVVCIN